MKKAKKLTLDSIKIKSFTTTITKNEKAFIRGGSTFTVTSEDTQNDLNCTQNGSGDPQCMPTSAAAHE